jgi:hypothetical protein
MGAEILGESETSMQMIADVVMAVSFGMTTIPYYF